MKDFFVTLLIVVVFTTALLGQSNPVPFVNQPLVPEAVVPGGAGFTLTVNGTGFVSGSVVNWNGNARTTLFVNGSQVSASISAADIAVAGTASVSVSNPAPGGGTSNAVWFSMTGAKESLSFAPATTYLSSSMVIQAADLNNDGKLDVAALGSNDVLVQLGNGDGTFQSQVDYSAGPPGQNCDYLVAADVNGDGFLDLLLLDAQTKDISVLLNLGDGTFQAAVLYPTSAISPPQSFAVGDFNGDGALDIAVLDTGEATLSIMLGNGNGSFQSAQVTNCGFLPTWIGVGDFNGDGKLDLIVIDEVTFATYMLLGAGDGTFSNVVLTQISNGLYKLVIGDFNRDGRLDIAAITYDFTLEPSVSVLLGVGDGTFQQPVQYATGRVPTGLALGDVDGDGRLDLVVGNSQDSTFSVLFGNGDGTFQTQRIVWAVNAGTNAIVTADFNRDGRMDIAANGMAFLQTDSLSFSQSALTFPVQVVGTTSETQFVTLTNITGSTIEIPYMFLMGRYLYDFSETNDCPASLDAGAQCTLSITFSPGAKFDRSAFIYVLDGTSSAETVWLTGTGTVASVSASHLDFGVQAVGTRSAPQTFTLKNTGARSLTISEIEVAGSDKSEFSEKNDCGSSVAFGSACTVTVFFAPKTTGTRNAFIRIVDNGGGSPQKVTLRGMGQ